MTQGRFSSPVRVGITTLAGAPGDELVSSGKEIGSWDKYITTS